MAVTNTIRPQATAVKPSNGEFTYLANGEEVRLSAGMVKKYLVSGDAQNVTDQEVMMFLTLCKYQHLNPFLREAYLVKYGNTPATIVTGKDTFTKRAEKNPAYGGKKAGIIVLKPDGEVEQREGTFYLPTEQIVGGWAEIYVKGREPETNTVSFEEYAGRKRDGSLNSQWASKPATMIRKVAVVQALREAFPNDFGAMYSPEEMGDVNEIIPEDDTPVVVTESAPQAVPEPKAETPQTTQPEESAADALFGGR
jgi:phage recombination protein Bet